jgi:hypothetical protein
VADGFRLGQWIGVQRRTYFQSKLRKIAFDVSKPFPGGHGVPVLG